MEEDEVEQDSGGLYDTSPSFSPDFLSGGDSEEESARDRLRNSEDAASSDTGGFYEGAKEKEQGQDKKGNRGGAGPTGETSGAGAGGKNTGIPKIKGGGLSKAIIPIAVVVFVLIIVFIVLIFLGQGSFASSYKALETEKHNTTTVSAAATTDNMINSVQLGESESESAYGDLAYANVPLSEEQIRDFEDAGFKYSEEEKVLSYELPGGETVVITGDSRVGVTKTGETIADNGASTDGGDVDYEAVKEEILANLGLSPEVAVVEGFSEAMQNGTIKEKYMIATSAYRGDVATWFTPVADTMVARLGISRDFFRNFEKSGSNEKDYEAIEKIIEERGHTEDASTGQSLEERAEKIIANSSNNNCGAISAFNEIEGVTMADETYKQMLITAMYLESIDKTLAGYGTEAPQATITTMLMQTGAAGSEYMQDLFGGKTLSQNSEAVKNISPQANGVDLAFSVDGEVNEEEYRACEYIGNTTVYDNAGFTSRIASIFQRAFSSIIGIFKGEAEGASSAAVAVLNPQIARFNQMKERKYFGTDVDGNVQGGGIGTATERYFGEHAKSEGQTIGSLDATVAFKRVQEEVVAENAWLERRTKSPFDITSKNTFLGSIVTSMMPLAVNSSSLTLTSTMSTLGSALSNSITSLLPTSSAISDAELVESIGDCVMQNSTTAIANVNCNPYYGSDPSLFGTTPIQAFESAASMRYDDEGTYIGGYAFDYEDGEPSVSRVATHGGGKSDIKKRSADTDPMYMDGPVNEEEANYEHHWSDIYEEKLEIIGEYGTYEGEPKGCESNWYHERRYIGYDLNGNGIRDDGDYVPYYNFDWPIEWKYSRGPTNFEYMGYQSGWPNLLASGTIGQELAENNAEPGECVLDFKIDKQKMPVVNINGALATYIIVNGQRNSEYGVADNENVLWLSKADFTQGRIHPCNLGVGVELNKESNGYPSDYEKYCENPYINEWNWGPYDNYSMEEAVTRSDVISRWVSGTAYTVSSGNTNGVNVGAVTDDFYKRFEDPTRGGANFWEEQKYYQNFIEKNEWMDSAGLIKGKTPTYKTIARYYNENPLDQSYEGIIARYSGKSKEQVIAVLDLLDYAEFLAKYDPTDKYPLGPVEEEEIQYDDMTVVAEAEKAVMNYAIVYDELRNRTVAA